MFGRGGRRSASSGGKAGSGTKSAKKKARTTEDDAFDAELTAQVKELRQAMEEGVWDEEAMREVVAEMERLCEGRYERDGPGYFEEDEADGVGDGLNDFLIRMKSEILREVKLAVKKTSLFVELGKQVQQMPASVDLSALAKRASKEFPILWAAVETISRAAGKGKDELTFIRLCNLLKCGAKFCSGMAYLMSFASIFNGVNRSGFDTLFFASVCGQGVATAPKPLDSSHIVALIWYCTKAANGRIHGPILFCTSLRQHQLGWTAAQQQGVCWPFQCSSNALRLDNMAAGTFHGTWSIRA
jgi:hypothetical protein